MNLQITYVDDQTPNSYRTYANYKKIVVTVLRKGDSKQLTKEVTFLSAAAKNAATESVITAVLMDFGNGAPRSRARRSTSAPARRRRAPTSPMRAARRSSRR